MSKPYDEYENPHPQIVMFIMACVVLVFFVAIPSLAPHAPDHRPSGSSGSMAVVEACVTEKGAWTCLKAFGDVVDGQNDAGSNADMGLIDAFPSAVPVSRLLEDCGRTPECMMYMASHGYHPADIAKELEQ